MKEFELQGCPIEFEPWANPRQRSTEAAGENNGGSTATGLMGLDPRAPRLDWLGGEWEEEATMVGVKTGPDRGRGLAAARPNAAQAWAAGRPFEILQPG